MPAPQVQLWADVTRSRDVPVLVRWPQDKAQGVVIYSHGLGGKKEGGDVWGQAWAAAGFVAVHLQHPGNGETPESRRRVYEALPTGKKAMLWLDGADHFTFAGNHKQIPSTMIVRREQETLQAEERHHQIAATISTAWLREQLLGISMGKPASLGARDEWLIG
jgi:hypothetical protein